MNHLVPCPECSRHVRVCETECPFCAHPLDLAGTPEPALPRERLSRAATLGFSSTRAASVALGATLVSATALACGASASVPVYGAPAGSANVAGAVGTAGAAGSGGANNGAGGIAIGPVYGAPAAGGSGNGSSGSSNSGGGHAPVPVYGAPQ